MPDTTPETRLPPGPLRLHDTHSFLLHVLPRTHKPHSAFRRKRRLRKGIPPCTLGGYSASKGLLLLYLISCALLLVLFQVTVCIIHLVRTTARFHSLYRQEGLAPGIAKVDSVQFPPQRVVDDFHALFCVLKAQLMYADGCSWIPLKRRKGVLWIDILACNDKTFFSINL